ncbi:restriction endonuclease subunit S [Shewanella oncorhynchi]|uniref:restriction endonuclease subunit S n=1 Tax=Shewanella oncorhynchi TaxID=2726434 RepID=UPI003D7B0AEB
MSWPMVKLGDVAPSRPLKNPKIEDTERVWQLNLDMVEANSGQVIEKCYQSLGEAGSSTHWFDANHVLYSKLRPYLNKVVTPDEQGLATTELVPLLPDPKRLDRHFLAYYLRSSEFVQWISEQVAGAKMPRVSMDLFWNHEIPLPPLAEQKRIAAILDKADAIRRKRQQAIQLADDFLRAVFLEMFGDPVTNQKGWEEAVLKDIADIRSGVTKGKKINPDDAITLPYMRVANVQDGYLALDDIQEITVSRRDAEKCKLMIGDILLTEGGDPDKLGRGYVWSGEIDNCIHQNHIFSVRVNDQSKIRPAFLSAVISSQRGKQYFLKVGKQTTGIATINKTVLSEFLPFIPPVEVQDKYLEISKKVRSLFLGWGDNCSYAFNALSQKAFSGQL